jgi:hypothetical protein
MLIKMEKNTDQAQINYLMLNPKCLEKQVKSKTSRKEIIKIGAVCR